MRRCTSCSTVDRERPIFSTRLQIRLLDKAFAVFHFPNLVCSPLLPSFFFPLFQDPKPKSKKKQSSSPKTEIKPKKKTQTRREP